MPKLDGTGPEGEGPLTGRKMGKCREVSEHEKLDKLGKGVGVRRKTGGGKGQGKRFKSGEK
jgi:hypothetical protein